MPPAAGADDNICLIFAEKADWFDDAARAERWDIPIPVLMAIMYQESSFRAKAKPPRLRSLILQRPQRSWLCTGEERNLGGYVEAEGGSLRPR